MFLFQKWPIKDINFWMIISSILNIWMTRADILSNTSSINIWMLTIIIESSTCGRILFLIFMIVHTSQVPPHSAASGLSPHPL